VLESKAAGKTMAPFAAATQGAHGFAYHPALARSRFRVSHEGEGMEAYRSGSVNGIALRSGENPRRRIAIADHRKLIAGRPSMKISAAK
jgi:hypothetical protein